MKETRRLIILFLMLALVMGTVSFAEATSSPAKPVISSVQCIDNSYVKIKWNKVSGADKYIVYRASEKDGEYKFLKKTANTYYCDRSINDTKTYYYKVQAEKLYSDKTTMQLESVKSALSSYCSGHMTYDVQRGYKCKNVSGWYVPMTLGKQLNSNTKTDYLIKGLRYSYAEIEIKTVGDAINFLNRVELKYDANAEDPLMIRENYRANELGVVKFFNYLLKGDYKEVGIITADGPEGKVYYSYLRKRDTYYVLSPLEYAGYVESGDSWVEELPKGIHARSQSLAVIEEDFKAFYENVCFEKQYSIT